MIARPRPAVSRPTAYSYFSTRTHSRIVQILVRSQQQQQQHRPQHLNQDKGRFCCHGACKTCQPIMMGWVSGALGLTAATSNRSSTYVPSCCFYCEPLMCVGASQLVHSRTQSLPCANAAPQIRAGPSPHSTQKNDGRKRYDDATAPCPIPQQGRSLLPSCCSPGCIG
jgi:hypothetical protein